MQTHNHGVGGGVPSDAGLCSYSIFEIKGTGFEPSVHTVNQCVGRAQFMGTSYTLGCEIPPRMPVILGGEARSHLKTCISSKGDSKLEGWFTP